MAPGCTSSSSKKNEVKNGKVAKRSKKVMTLKEKIAVLDKLRSGTSYAACGREFKVNESTIRSIKKSEKSIRDAVAACPPATAKVTQHVRDLSIIKMEKALNIWIEDLNRRFIPVDSQAIREKATKLYEHYSQNTDSSFKASKGWFENFKKRYSLHNLKLMGETASADHAAAEKYQDEFEKMVQEKGYLPEQVFNADETGLFWKKMPSRTFLSQQERQAPGFKAAKDRVSVLLCGNAAGHMIKSMFLYKGKRPRCFKGKNMNMLPLFYRSNKKAWMTSVLMTDESASFGGDIP